METTTTIVLRTVQKFEFFAIWMDRIGCGGSNRESLTAD